jgi:hypothetical protein
MDDFLAIRDRYVAALLSALQPTGSAGTPLRRPPTCTLAATTATRVRLLSSEAENDPSSVRLEETRILASEATTTLGRGAQAPSRSSFFLTAPRRV